MKRSGIYHIQIGPWFYYGQSVNLVQRRTQHIRSLNANKHCNQILQRAYNKYQAFEFTIVGEIAPDELDGAEQFFLDCFHDTEHCANLCSIAQSCKGIKRVFTEEHKRNISLGQKGRPRYGGGTPPKPVEIDGILYASQKEAARQLGIDPRTVDRRIQKGIYLSQEAISQILPDKGTV